MRHLLVILLTFLSLLSCSSNKDKKIAIQPYGNFSQLLLDTIQASIERTYSFETVILSSIELPKSAFINVKSPRYRADTIIAQLRQDKIDSIDHIIGLTHSDISTTKRDGYGNVLEPSYKYEDWGFLDLDMFPALHVLYLPFDLKPQTSNC